MSASWTEQVLAPSFLRGLDELVIAGRRARRALSDGGSGGLPRASGLEWVDHRPYAPGDDLRHLDWHLMARFDRPFVRRFHADGAERLDLLIDRSRSLTVGTPAKGDTACALAFALGYVALAIGGRVASVLFAERVLARLPAGKGPAHRARLLDFLRRAPYGTRTGLGPALASFAECAREVGRVVLISDLLDTDVERGLACLRRRGFQVGVVRLRSADDEDPRLAPGPWQIEDVETGERTWVRLGVGDPERYRSTRRAEVARLAAFCSGLRIAVAPVDAERPLDQLVFGDLRRSGLVDGLVCRPGRRSPTAPAPDDAGTPGRRT